MLSFLATCASTPIPEASPLALQYYASGNLLWIASQTLSLLIPLLFLWCGWNYRLEKWAYRFTSKWYSALLLFFLAFFAISSLLTFPLELYQGFFREHAYGLSTQPLSRFLSNWGKSFLISTITSLLFLWIIYFVIRKKGKTWWIYASIAMSTFALLSVWIVPLWIAPLFHHFGPMKDPALEAQILSLASASGIEGARVFEVDMSQDTSTLNAYVTGIGSSKRIVLWDTTIAKLPPQELLFVMGHEMGHYVLHHIWWYLGFATLSSFALFYLTYISAQYLLRRFGNTWRCTSLAQLSAWPLLLLTFTFWQFLFTPLDNAFSRHFERAADRFGLDVTHNNSAAGQAFVLLQQQNLANPSPGKLFVFWRASHPTLASRIEFANTYCPWDSSE